MWGDTIGKKESLAFDRFNCSNLGKRKCPSTPGRRSSLIYIDSKKKFAEGN